MNELVNPNNVIDNIFYDKHVRIVMIDNDPWFVAKDVALALEYKDTVNAIKTHVENDDKCNILSQEQNIADNMIDGVATHHPIEIPDYFGRMQTPVLINESGVYALIFGSKLEKAKTFKHWITSQVLPSIRKTGKYEVIKKSPLEIAHEALTLITTELEKANQQLENAQPAIEFTEQVSTSNNAISIQDFTAYLDIQVLGQNKLFEWLRISGYLMDDNLPYRNYIENGYFRVIEQTYWNGCANKTSSKTLITGKGQVYLATKIRESV